MSILCKDSWCIENPLLNASHTAQLELHIQYLKPGGGNVQLISIEFTKIKPTKERIIIIIIKFYFTGPSDPK